MPPTHILKQTGSSEQASHAVQDSPDMVAKHYGRFLPQDKAALAAQISIGFGRLLRKRTPRVNDARARSFARASATLYKATRYFAITAGHFAHFLNPHANPALMSVLEFMLSVCRCDEASDCLMILNSRRVDPHPPRP